MKLRIGNFENPNYYFSTVDKFIDEFNEYDLIIIDECSMIENLIMLKIINNYNYDSLLLVGDIYQIESIDFGNWFRFAKEFLKNQSYELTENFRTSNNGLKKIWSKVRNLESGITEKIIDENYSEILNESIFQNIDEEEIVLCLNYDGPYGINNINKYLQNRNNNVPVEWGVNTYKVNVPIIFNDLKMYKNILYNNLKGRIVGIVKCENKIIFDLMIERTISDFENVCTGLNIIENFEDSSLVRIEVYSKEDDDQDDEKYHIVPFAVSYASSIHKSQGLEYNSVKIIISSEVEEQITKNIFYTAITRSKSKLKIYWSAETQEKVLDGMIDCDLKYDLSIIKTKID